MGHADDFRIGTEETQDGVSLPVNEEHQKGRHAQAKPQADPKDTTATGVIAGTVVLADKGRRCLPVGVDEAIDVDFDNKGCCRSGHGIGTEAVDGRLDDNVGNTKDHALNPCRETNAHDRCQILTAYMQVSQVQMEDACIVPQEAKKNP